MLSAEQDPLLERGDERAGIDDLLDRATSGRGGVVVVEGPAGIGKTRLLDVTRGWATERGFVVSRAVGGALEQDFAFGAVRQLFEVLVADSSDPDDLFRGAAASAAALLGRARPPVPHGDDSPGVILHALYWVTVALADQGRPLALVCDDVHWMDVPSLRFLAYLTNRISELPVALIIGTRPPGPEPEGELLTRLIAHENVVRLRPAPLSGRAVRTLVQSSLDVAPASEFCDAVTRGSRGNPYLVTEVMRAVRASGLNPDQSSAARLADVMVDASLLARIGQMTPDVRNVARATAVLGPDAHLRHVAAMAGLDIDTAGAAADALLRADVLGAERPLRFVHPLVMTAVDNDLLPGERSALHRRAAALLAAEHRPVGQLAAHYMVTEPAGDPEVVDVLVRSARLALAQGATDVSIAQLRRALAEPPSARERMGIVLSLGAAESLVLDPGAIDHLGQAIEGITNTGVRVMFATARAVSMCVAGRPVEAVAVLRALEPEVVDDEHLQLALLAGLNFVGATGPLAGPLVSADVADLARRVGHDSTAPAGVLGVRAYIGACTGEATDLVVRLAHRALDDVAEDDPMLPMWFHLAVAALIMADRDLEAASIIERRLTAARRTGAPGQVSIALFMRAMVAFRAGELDDAEADARASLDQCQQYRIDYVLPGPLAVLVDVLRERDDLEGAGALLREHGYATGDGDSLFHLFLLHARGRWHGACERWDDAITDLRRGWRRSLDTGITSPNLIAWRANIAFAEVMSGRPQAGTRDLARVALDEAEAFGSVRSRAEAQRALAMSGDPASIALAVEAAETFARLGARMETCRTLVVYATTSAAGTPAAVDALVEALRQAETFGAKRLGGHARTRLRSAGVRRPVRPVSGPGALTAGERRVATLAAVGRSNKEVAQELFVTVKTVETHLSHTYQKLLITSRAELQHALAP